MSNATKQGYIWIRAVRIRRDPAQPRKRFNAAKLQELVDSLKECGQLEPIIVRPIEGDADHDWELIAGERRLKAAPLAGLERLKAIVQTDPLDDDMRFVLEVVSNLVRDDLTPMEIANSIDRLAKKGWSEERIARAFAHSQRWVTLHRYLLLLDPVVQALVEPDALEDERISVTKAGLLRTLPPNFQRIAAKEISRRGMTSEHAKRYVRELERTIGVGSTRSHERGVDMSNFKEALRHFERLVDYLDASLTTRSATARELFTGRSPDDKVLLMTLITDAIRKLDEFQHLARHAPVNGHANQAPSP